MGYVMAHMFPLFTHCFLVMVAPSTCVGPWGAHSGLCRGVFVAGAVLLRHWLWLRETECAWEERKNWPCCCGPVPQPHILLTCLTPGKKPIARLWTESRMSVSSLLRHSLSRTTASAVFSSCCSSCSVARYAVTACLLPWIYWHTGNRLQDLTKIIES